MFFRFNLNLKWRPDPGFALPFAEACIWRRVFYHSEVCQYSHFTYRQYQVILRHLSVFEIQREIAPVNQ